MFRSYTLLVLGAGASAEVGLPIGTGLLKDIAARLVTRRDDFGRELLRGHGIHSAIMNHLAEKGSVSGLVGHLMAADQICLSSTQAMSIDYIIDALEDPAVELMGKLAIASAILDAERASSFFSAPVRGSGLDLSRFEGTWYNQLTRLLTEGVRRSDADRIFENLEIITFNYDRTLEHYLPESLAAYFGGPVQRFQEIVAEGLTIHRPFGSVGRLEWETRAGPSIGFGKTSHHGLYDAASQLRTFTERIDDDDILRALRNSVSESDRVIFLGFAFHRQNLELIAAPATVDWRWDPIRLAMATVKGISASDQDVVRAEIGQAVGMPRERHDYDIRLSDMTCNQFFQEHWRTLTA